MNFIFTNCKLVIILKLRNKMTKLYRLLVIIFLLFVHQSQLLAQPDTLVTFDVRTKAITVIAPQKLGSSTTFDFTNWNLGSFFGVVNLSQDSPTNTPSNSGFIDLIPAHELFDVTMYPVRTAVKIFKFVGDSLSKSCSGTMVSNDLVLTSAHCVFYNFDYTPQNKREFRDSLLVVPVFDNGQSQPVFGSSISRKYYIPKTWFDGKQGTWDDIALVELQEQIGVVTGWIGIAFSNDLGYFENRVFHKFSYPGTVSPFDSTKIFNGDTLYYNYGTLDYIGDQYLGYGINGIPGQSGSSIFYSDNSVYYLFGIQIWSINSRHYRIGKDMFYALKSIIEPVVASIGDVETSIPKSFALSVFPNPVYMRANLVFSLAMSHLVSLRIYNVMGQEITTVFQGNLTQGQYRFEFSTENLTQGVYFAQLRSNFGVRTAKLLVVK